MKGQIITTVGSKILRKMGPLGLKLQKKAPLIFAVTGGVSIAAGTVLACRATLKLKDTLEDIKEDIDSVKATEPEIDENGNEVSIEPEAKDIFYAYIRAGWKMTKLYGPAAACLAGGCFCLIRSYSILTKTNAALVSAYTVLESEFDKYRERVRQEAGVEKDKHYMYGTGKPQKYHTEVTDNDGTTIVEDGSAKTIEESDYDIMSQYSRIFDECNPNWKGICAYNELFLHSQQNICNNLLGARGWLTLNEVYDMLGYEPVDYGFVVGWVKGGDGNGVVDFNLEPYSCHSKDSYKLSYLLDFNVKSLYHDRRFIRDTYPEVA